MPFGRGGGEENRETNSFTLSRVHGVSCSAVPSTHGHFVLSTVLLRLRDQDTDPSS